MLKKRGGQATKPAQASTPTQEMDQVKRKLILKTPKSPKTKLKTGVPKVNSVRRSAQDSATDGLDDVEPKSTAKEVPNEASVEERLLDESLQARIVQAYQRGRRDAEKAPTSRVQEADKEEYRSPRVHDQARQAWIEPVGDAAAQATASRMPFKPRHRYGGGLNLKVFMTDYIWIAKANGWDTSTSRTFLRYYIDDPALQVYDDLVQQRANEGVEVEDIPIQAIYDGLEAQFMSTHAKNKAHYNLFRLRKQQGETVSDFLTRFRQVAQLASVPDDAKLADTFLRATKMHIVNNNFQTLREASDAAMRVEEANDVSEDDTDIRHPRSKALVLAQVFKSTTETEAEHDELLELEPRTAERSTSPTCIQDVRVRPSSSPLERVQCNFCDIGGHTIAECWEFRKFIRHTANDQCRSSPKRQYDTMSSGFGSQGAQAYKCQRTQYDDNNLYRARNNISYQRAQGDGASVQRPELRTCFGCNQPGHIRANCPGA
jgi:hypothetical protein